MTLDLFALGVLMAAPWASAQAPQPSRAIAAPCRPEALGEAGPSVGIGPTRRPRVRKQAMAAAPSEFLATGTEGRVVVRITVGTDGVPCDIQVDSSRPTGVGLDEAGIESAAGWRFTPAQRDGVAVSAPIVIEFTFAPFTAGKSHGQRYRTSRAKVKGTDLPGAAPRQRN